MHKYKSLFFSLFLFLCACSGDTIPDNIIKPEAMTALLTEVHLADGSMYNIMQLPDSLYKYGTGKYMKIFKNFHTDSVQFKNSMHYYTSRPDLLLTIFQNVTVNLKQKSDSLNKLNQQQIAKDNKRKADSLRKLPKMPPVPAKPVQTPAVSPPGKHFVNKRYLPKLPPKNVVP